ncbi:MAG: hypothetical protein LBD53_04480 [Tannerella sp.]|nr:hypothetical protein [Tannerella sp.]
MGRHLITPHTRVVFAENRLQGLKPLQGFGIRYRRIPCTSLRAKHISIFVTILPLAGRFG